MGIAIMTALLFFELGAAIYAGYVGYHATELVLTFWLGYFVRCWADVIHEYKRR